MREAGTPYLDTESRGVILGLTFADNRSTIAKAIMEGLTFELGVNLELLKCCGIRIDRLYAAGGGAKSALWLQMKSDITQIPLSVPRVTEAACLGAALLAGVGAGMYDDFHSAVGYTVSIQKEVQPDITRVKQYNTRFKTYKKMYPALKNAKSIIGQSMRIFLRF